MAVMVEVRGVTDALSNRIIVLFGTPLAAIS
jgi:hypothetical protein